jgi:hypothetical protein|tara:strand:- start:503 stop:802 length:300 start_codon:yes stop_codon:yes gene_type:complete
MALGNKTAGQIHDKTSSDLAAMKGKYDNSKHHTYIGFDEIDAILYQMQLMQDDIDELRRYITSAELLLPDTIGDSLPLSDPSSAGQLWNNRGVLTVSRG